MDDDKITRGDHKELIMFNHCQEIVMIKIARVTIPVHKSLICRSSKFFISAFKTFTTTELKDFRDNELNIYLNWLYTDTVRSNGFGFELMSEYTLLADLYFFGVKIEDRTFRNAVITAVFEAAQDPDGVGGDSKLPDMMALNTAYKLQDGLPSQCGIYLRKALVEIYATECDPSEIDRVVEEGEAVPGEFMASLVRRLMETRAGEPRALADINPCEFHEVEEGQGECDHRRPAGERHRPK